MNGQAQRKAELIGALTNEPVPVAIYGDCMEPWLSDGEQVMIRKSRLYKPGDILVYCNANGQLIAHRMLGYYYWKGEWRLLIKADNALQPDGGVPTAHILGKVLENNPGVMRRLQSLALFFRFTLRKIRR